MALATLVMDEIEKKSEKLRKQGPECRGERVEDLLHGWLSERWSECVNHMQLEIAKGNYGRAHAVLSRFVHRDQRVEMTIDSSIWALEGFVDVEALEALEKAGYDTIRLVALARDAELRRIRAIGAVRLAKLKAGIETLMEDE